jgi:hypothetical protein
MSELVAPVLEIFIGNDAGKENEKMSRWRRRPGWKKKNFLFSPPSSFHSNPI